MLVIGGYVDPQNWMSSLTHDIMEASLMPRPLSEGVWARDYMEAVNLLVPRQEIAD